MFQHLVTDTGDETWSFTLRRIMKSLKNIEDSMKNCRNRQAIDAILKNQCTDIFYQPTNRFKKPSKLNYRSKNKNDNENYNFIKNIKASSDELADSDYDLYDDYRNDASDSTVSIILVHVLFFIKGKKR